MIYKDNNLMKNRAFTLAEVLITLVVIGIIASITVPLIMENHRKVETITRLKKFHSTMCNAFRRAEVENGSSINWDWGNNNGRGTPFADVVFLKVFPIISPYLSYTKQDKSFIDKFQNKEAYGVYLNDGTYFYVPNNHIGNYTDMNTGLYHPCMYFTFDVNGQKKPNELGRDLFTFTYCQSGHSRQLGGKAITPSSIPDVQFYSSYSRSKLIQECKNQRSEFKAASCLQLIIHDGWQIKSDYPLRI